VNRAAWPAERSLRIALAALLLAACASEPKRPGFYSEDGPPERVPPNLLSTPDAIPRDEAPNPYANRPYVALGRTYVPDVSNAPFHQRGIASWYGRQFQGNRTASGEQYDMFAMTAAHRTLPIPSYARVTNTHDGRSVIVRINDRGPFLRDRIIDLSYVAAARLGIAGPGSGEVEVERIIAGSQIARAAAPSPAARPAAAPAAPAAQLPGAAAAAAPADASAAVAFAVPPAGSEPAPRALPDPALGPTAGAGAASATADAPPSRPAAGGAHWSVQLGAFAVATNAEALRDRLALLLGSPEAAALPVELHAPRIERMGGLNRVLIGDSAEHAVAVQWSRLLERYLARPTVLYVR
jgi:peptidoglycan lytic transglycosylase